MAPAVPIKYNFYHSDGLGRDSFIQHVSQNQTSFTYVPKSPEFVGTRMPGMATSTPNMTKSTTAYLEKPRAVTGYTGHLMPPPHAQEQCTPSDAFPNLGPAPVPVMSLRSSFDAEHMRHKDRVQSQAYRIPGYAGHCPGNQHVAGFSNSAICLEEGGPTNLASIGPGAPGSTENPQIIKSRNLQPGYSGPGEEQPRTKTGYTGHLPGRHYSSNFGKSFNVTALELIKDDGMPAAGGVADPGQPFNSDTNCKLQYPTGHVGRPQRSQTCIAGYQGFRPQTTPIWDK